MAHVSLAHRDHRPWPLPRRPWFWKQRWTDLVFAHWIVDPAELERHLPEGLELDLWEGQAYVGVIWFQMSRASIRLLPPLPFVSRFPEVNVRTYVTRDGRPGVFFLSLDAPALVGGFVGRHLLSIPYRHVPVRRWQDVSSVCYQSLTPTGARVAVKVQPMGGPTSPGPGSLAWYLTERYAVHSATVGERLRFTDVHHGPWRLSRAEGDVEAGALLSEHGLTVDGPPVDLRYSKGQDVVAWWPTDR